MNRRGFLSMLGSAAVMPAIPMRGVLAAPAAVASYSRYMFGLCMFHTSGKASLTAKELAANMRISLEQSKAMIAEMQAKGVLKVSTNGGFEAIRKHGGAQATYVRRAKRVQPDVQKMNKASQTQETTMDKFENLSGIAAPMPLVNIDTDMIIPKVFLKTIKRSGLGANLFDEMRFDREGNEIEDFVLNKPAYREAQIIVAGDNFGCGSSREHAPWALADFGIKSVISTSFADIFYNNCFKNGILPIVLPQEAVDVLMKDAEKGANARMDIDLVAQTVTTSDGEVFAFELDSFKKHCLLNGLDDIGLTMEKVASIDTFEGKASAERPWV